MRVASREGHETPGFVCLPSEDDEKLGFQEKPVFQLPPGVDDPPSAAEDSRRSSIARRHQVRDVWEDLIAARQEMEERDQEITRLRDGITAYRRSEGKLAKVAELLQKELTERTEQVEKLVSELDAKRGHDVELQQRQQQQQQQQAAQAQALQAAQAQAQAAQSQEQARLAKQRREDKLREQAAERDQAEKSRCHLHKKPKNNCKFCQRYQDFIKGMEEKSSAKEGGVYKAGRGHSDHDRDKMKGPLEIANPKTFGFSPLLQTHIVESAHFKALLTLESFDQLIEEMYQFADNIEPYMTNSNTTPSALFCCLYRLFTMGIDKRQLGRLIDNVDNAYVRCIGFLYIRFGLHPDQLWSWLGEYVLDDEELRPQKDSEWVTTIGEFVEGLLSQDKYYSTVLPRLPMSTKRQLDGKLAPIPQCRKRTKANAELLEVYREEGVRVEANLGGSWRQGITMELIEDAPSRLKVLVRMEDDTEEVVHLGKMILADRRFANYQGKPRGGRSRSRSRDRIDWARQKGRSDKELVDEMRRVDREKAVCSSGKEYARKPVGYKAACALPREQGAASHRLMEEETFVPMKQSRRRSPSPNSQQQEFRKAPSAEHQARMQQLFEKYGMAKSSDSNSNRADIDTPDVMRFG
mmetsp:Transcript_56627/g.175558  ORF Transcript_56627/g.175558 Transcript_56627/m.175558 type:complete len:636 (-) Transcript_56627:242-2149(-)